MYLDLLKKIMPPPEIPLNNGDMDKFYQINNKLNINLPIDYCKFIIEYGEGNICDDLCIYSPFSKIKHFNLINQIEIMGDAYIYLKNKHGIMGEMVGYPFDFYPSADGLLPFGRTYSGYEFYWKMSQYSNWGIVVYPDMPDYLEYDMCMTEFLYKLLTNQIDCMGLSNFIFDGVLFSQFLSK